MKKKLILALILVLFFTSCSFGGKDNITAIDNNNKKIDDNKKINDNLIKNKNTGLNSEQSKIINKDYEKFNGKKDSTIKKIEPTIKTGYNTESNHNLLSNIAKSLEKEEGKTKEERIKKEKQIKGIINNYFKDINSDKDIIQYISPKSIEKITKNTRLVYSVFSQKEKINFLQELKGFGFKEDSFDINKQSDMNKYIGFIIKGGFKIDGGIKEIVYKRLDLTNNFKTADIAIIYNKAKTKKVKIFLDKNNKIIINN